MGSAESVEEAADSEASWALAPGTWRPATLALDQVNEGAALAVSFVKQGTAAGDAGCRAWRRPPATSGWTRGTDPVRRRSRRAEARLELLPFVPALDGRTQARNLALRSLLSARHEEGKQRRPRTPGGLGRWLGDSFLEPLPGHARLQARARGSREAVVIGLGVNDVEDGDGAEMAADGRIHGRV